MCSQQAYNLQLTNQLIVLALTWTYKYGPAQCNFLAISLFYASLTTQLYPETHLYYDYV